MVGHLTVLLPIEVVEIRPHDHLGAHDRDLAHTRKGNRDDGDSARLAARRAGRFAFRGALLAQAVLAAVERGEDRERCLGHYAGRLRAVFASHLHGCVPHYRAARHAAIWRDEVADMETLARRLAVDAFGFRVQGRDLVAMPAATQPHATP